MKKSIAVIGLSRFGFNLLEAFSRLDVDLIGIDHDIEAVKKASEITHNVMVADSTSYESLKDAGIANVDHAIVAVGQNDKANLTNSIVTIIRLKELGVEKITARADEEDYAQVLKLVGATDVVMPLSIASERVANRIAAFNLVDYFNIKGDYTVFEVKLSETFPPAQIIDLDLRNEYEANIMLIERDSQFLMPKRDTEILPNDEIFIFSKKKDIAKITAFFTSK
ncbi:potassium channel family protein [Acholeplasma hippikon]|uniref:Trk system potassium uptake proteinTrkA n=1 Tax=Acholeplasma hippikon TaxID=264636 RepID=A0A449BHT6_9MOLU|nr:TrkA family potassium uptake protein [Acholeplasma hippikon]VEU82019.1 Trk system potassium uptake proteinTrkA [Acholeplasma hippikon]